MISVVKRWMQAQGIFSTLLKVALCIPKTDICIYIYIYIYIWVNYNDLTATSLESWLIRAIIPKWP